VDRGLGEERGVPSWLLKPDSRETVHEEARRRLSIVASDQSEQAWWTAEWAAFHQRDLSQVDYVYPRADGVHFNIRLEQDRPCCLVLIGVRADGHKETDRRQ
jgi:hypothetical protein